ncbi:Uncharacterised protein [uncultured archaeon]|nr:Uncharacterised protein [uncultured archaeon]
MEKHNDQSALMKTVDEIRAVEEKHDRIIASAKDEAEKILRNAREKIVEEREKMEDENIAFKNERLKEGRNLIEAEVEKILDKAKEEGAKLKKKKLDKKTMHSLGLATLK